MITAIQSFGDRTNNENSFLFESGDIKKLVGCIKNAEHLSDKEYQNMSRAARCFAEEKYDKEEYYSKLIEIYKKASLLSRVR